MISVLLAASISFTATATGVGKGTPLEFLFAGRDSDRDYETMFLLDESVEALCRRAEAAGLPRGRPASAADCVLWPVGCRVSVEPKMSEFVETDWPQGIASSDFVYTGGTRDEKGVPVANAEMPLAFCALYSLAQSPVVFNGIYRQGDVYGAHRAKVALEKGTRRAFTLTWDAKTLPAHLDVTFAPGTAGGQILKVKEAADRGDVDVCVSFDPSLTVREATRLAQTLSLVDSAHVKLNGRPEGRLFYRAFLPDVRWRDRQQRMVQPFEATVGDGDAADSLVFVEEDWTVEGDDPKLTPKRISFADAAAHPKTDTCFIYAGGDVRLARLYAVMEKMKGAKVRNWYVFAADSP